MSGTPQNFKQILFARLLGEWWPVTVTAYPTPMIVTPHFLPNYISEEHQIRLVVFGEDFCIPCGGTHVQTLSETPKITIRKIKMEKGKVRVSYAMMNE